MSKYPAQSTALYSALAISKPMILAALATAVAGCKSSESLPPSPAEDRQFEQSASAAMVAFDNGDVETSAQLYQRALNRGHVMDDSESVAKAAYNLAACEMTLNRFDAALSHLQEAKYNSANNTANLDEIQLLTAKVAYLRERNADAQSMAESLNSSNFPLIRLQAQTLLVLVACDLGDLTVAKSKLEALRKMTLKTPDASPAVSADVEKAEGMVATLDRQMHAAAEHFDRETDLLRSANRYRDVIHSLSRSGSAHDDANEFTAAADRYYRASLGCAALNDPSRARELAKKAFAAAKSAGDQELTLMIEPLIRETDPATAP